MEKIENYIVENQLKAEDKPLSEQELCKMWGFNHCVILHSGMEKIGVTYTNKDESDLLMVGEEVPVFF
ncbi:hypothetical protein [Weizmannia sp. FSL W8-0401]|uniref:hypothetical protein n=1 Tax=Weizmannia sp. FSL W8-0401 TaxID=2954554 RepID=UPI0030FAFB67